MNVVTRFLNKNPWPVVVVILACFVAGLVYTTDYVLNTVQPRQRAAFQAKVAAEIDEGDAKFERRRYDSALKVYRFVLAAYEDEIDSEVAGRLHHRIGECRLHMAKRKNEKENLAKSIAAFAKSLELRSLETAPEAYAETQTALGKAHYASGKSSGNPQETDAAIAAYGKALAVHTREAAPLRYAALQNLIGNAYRESFQPGRGQDDSKMEPAFAAYREALKFFRAKEHPQAYGQAHVDTGLAHMMLAQGNFPRTNTRKALAEYEDALTVFTKAKAPRDFGRTQRHVGDAYTLLWRNASERSGRRSREWRQRFRFQREAERAYELASRFGAKRIFSSNGNLK